MGSMQSRRNWGRVVWQAWARVQVGLRLHLGVIVGVQWRRVVVVARCESVAKA